MDDWSESSEPVEVNSSTADPIDQDLLEDDEIIQNEQQSLDDIILDYGTREYYNPFNRGDNGELPYGEYVPFYG